MNDDSGVKEYRVFVGGNGGDWNEGGGKERMGIGY